MSNNKQTANLDDMERLLSAIQSDKRMALLNLFGIYRELSLTDLSDKMEMSKPAIHHHLKMLREARLVQVTRIEDARGSIDKKYFGLTPGAHRFFVDDLKQFSNSATRFNMMKATVKALTAVYSELQYKINLAISFVQEMDHQMQLIKTSQITDQQLDLWQKQLDSHNTMLRYVRLNEEQHQKYKQAEENFVESLLQLKNDDGTDFPYLITILDMPIMKLLEFTT